MGAFYLKTLCYGFRFGKRISSVFCIISQLQGVKSEPYAEGMCFCDNKLSGKSFYRKNSFLSFFAATRAIKLQRFLPFTFIEEQ